MESISLGMTNGRTRSLSSDPFLFFLAASYLRNGEARHLKFGIRIVHGEYKHLHDRLPTNGV